MSILPDCATRYGYVHGLVAGKITENYLTLKYCPIHSLCACDLLIMLMNGTGVIPFVSIVNAIHEWDSVDGNR